MPYTLFFTMAFMPIISILFTVVTFYSLKFTESTNSSEVTKGEKLVYNFSVLNRSIFPCVHLKVYFPAETISLANIQGDQAVSAPPFITKSLNFEMVCKYRGTYEIGVSKVEGYDFLGIFKLTRKFKKPVKITVFPSIMTLNSFNLQEHYISELHSALNSSHEDMSSIQDVRKYEYGDGLNRIHWKLSAKSGETMVKKYQGTARKSMTMLLDISSNSFGYLENLSVEDKLIEAVVSILNHCLCKLIPCTLLYANDKVEKLEAQNSMSFSTLYNHLASIKFDSKTELKQLIDNAQTNAIGSSALLLFTCKLDFETYDMLTKLSHAGYDVGLVYVEPIQNTCICTDILDKLSEAGVDVYKINSNGNVKEALDARNWRTA